MTISPDPETTPPHQQPAADDPTSTVVVATFDDSEMARSAMRALEMAGVDGGDITFLAQGATAARGEADPAERDAGMAKEVAKFSIIGGGTGGLIALGAGFLAGRFLVGVDGSSLWAMTLAMGVVGLAIGALVVAIGKIGVSDSWGQSFEKSAATDYPTVQVHTREAAAEERVLEVLGTSAPLSVERRAGRTRRRGALTGGQAPR